MTSVEVLAPLRLETRFVPPQERTDGVAEWMLRVRVHPDEFSVARPAAPADPRELDRLVEAVAAMSGTSPLSERDAFASFAASVGAGRALLLWREHVVPDGLGGASVRRSGESEHEPFRASGSVGLPRRLEIWFVHQDGTRQPAATLLPDLAGIAADMDVRAVFENHPALAEGELPTTWWLSYERAVEVGLGVDIDVGAVPPVLDALVVLGLGDDDAGGLVGAHNASGRMAVLAQGTPTNTVHGEATTDFGRDEATVYPLLHADPAGQPSTRAVLGALTGRVPPGALPMLGGDLDHERPGSLVVRGLWPVLWGRSLRDVTGGIHDLDLQRWAAEHLAVEGPHPAIRIEEQPYGLLPTSSFAGWVADAGDPLAEIEDLIRRWGTGWRAGAAAAARAANHRVHGAGTAKLLDVLGLHAPSRRWRVRPVADLHLIQASRALHGMPPMPATDWDRLTADTFRRWPYPEHPIGPAAHSGPVPGPPKDAEDEAGVLRALIDEHPETLYHRRHEGLGLVGHLFREALIAGHAVIGDALEDYLETGVVDLGRSLPLDDEDRYRDCVLRGDDGALAQLDAALDANGPVLAGWFRETRDALRELADRWEKSPGQVFGTVLAALDTAAFRVDPWLTGLAERRLRRMIAEGAPFHVGAYGWVDAPAPFTASSNGSLPPGPTEAGLLHAPSHEQALTAALLRDAAVRNPEDERWHLRIDSAKVRASVALAERVRLGVHPYEALGLEVEKLAGDWDTVRVLREEYPLADGQDGRRVCDGAKVLRLARDGALVAGLPADLPERLKALDEVLDTYADLLVADGVHALVTGRADLANAAMEAAAGLGPPADLRGIRTPRAATTVRVSAWALLQPGEDPEPETDPAPVEIADPAYAALATAELGPGVLDATDSADELGRLATLLGGGEDEAPVPSLTGGVHNGQTEAAAGALLAAVVTDLTGRLKRLRHLAWRAETAVTTMAPTDPGTPAAVTALARRWNVDLTGVPPADPVAERPTPAELKDALAAALAGRLDATATVTGEGEQAVHSLRHAIRALAGRPELPVLPVVDRALLPPPRPSPDLDRNWLEIVAAVRPRLAPLEARQLDPGSPPWPSMFTAPGTGSDPWQPAGPVLVVYGPAVTGTGGRVAIAALDSWAESVPARRHATAAAFGFNAPKSRAPQAVLVAVPPDPSLRLTGEGLLDVVLETRELAHARAARPTDRGGLPHATPAALVHASGPAAFLEGWPT